MFRFEFIILVLLTAMSYLLFQGGSLGLSAFFGICALWLSGMVVCRGACKKIDES